MVSIDSTRMPILNSYGVSGSLAGMHCAAQKKEDSQDERILYDLKQKLYELPLGDRCEGVGIRNGIPDQIHTVRAIELRQGHVQEYEEEQAPIPLFEQPQCWLNRSGNCPLMHLISRERIVQNAEFSAAYSGVWMPASPHRSASANVDVDYAMRIPWPYLGRMPRNHRPSAGDMPSWFRARCQLADRTVAGAPRRPGGTTVLMISALTKFSDSSNHHEES